MDWESSLDWAGSGGASCPNCGETSMDVFYRVLGVPVHSVLLMPTRDIARSYRRGDIALGFCRGCGFISNLAFDPTVHEYSPRYEETQAFSPMFNLFHRRLAERLIDRYDLRGKRIIEIGCGKGQFLTLLCELGGNHGTGFDPSYVSGRTRSGLSETITFIQDFYSEKYSDYQADLICCKMTLEHIQNTADFVSMVRRSIGSQRDTIVFFQVPNVAYVLREIAFWDVYYEHCSYFSPVALARLFQNSGFEIISLEQDYDGQYLMLEARPATEQQRRVSDHGGDLAALQSLVSRFSRLVLSRLDEWRINVQRMIAEGRRVVLWGGGSKAVAFLTTLGIEHGIEYVVDINPYKRGTYVAGTGQEIVHPDFLPFYRPDVVIVMNPIYGEEIRQSLEAMGLFPRLLTVIDHALGAVG